MSGPALTSVSDPAAGRLPTPEIGWAISEPRFRALADSWRGVGLWLSLWSPDHQLQAATQAADPFWTLLTRSDGPFLAQLATYCACRIGPADSAPNAAPIKRSIGGPWLDAVPLLFVPIVERRRVIGAVIGACVTTGDATEEMRRFCGACQLDVEATAAMLRSHVVVDAVRVSRWLDLLSSHVANARELERQREEISILTDNLDGTYEELHLIYQISEQMGIPRSPEDLVASVGNELLGITRARAIAFVLLRQAYDAEATATSTPGPANREWGSVVQIGEGASSESELIRLTEQLDHRLCQAGKHLLLNKAGEDSAMSWARGWLKHLVAYPLRQDGTELGVCYTINCVDSGDFTSVDVQLFRAVVDRVTAALHNQHLYDDLADLLMGMLHALVNSVDAKDPYTFGHSGRVAYFSRALAQQAGMSRIDCERVYLAGLLHDIGKIGVPDAVLTKPGRLTTEEFDLLKKHPEIGQRILARVRQIQDLVPGVLYHHERMDGRGYPHGLAGRKIPLFGRIICIADSFDAMTSNRTYRAALPIPMAVAELRRCSGSQFDPFLAERFLAADPHALFEAAIDHDHGDPVIGRIGGLCHGASLDDGPMGVCL